MESYISRDIVLFLGAGFSFDAEMPLMKQFGAASDKELGRLKIPDNRRVLTDRLLTAGTVFHEFQDYCAKARMLVDISTENMETLFCIAEVITEAGACPTAFQAAGEQEYLLNQICFWLWKIYQRCPPSTWDGRTKSWPYDDLMVALKEPSLCSRLCVVTTNYDIVFEYFAWKHAILCAYPMADWKPLRYGRCVESHLAAPVADALTVCKLHGSINYLRPRRPEKGCGLLVADGLTDDNMPHGGRTIPAGPAIRALDAWSELEVAFGGELVPWIIPPTYAKLQQHEWLRDTWSTAFKAIRDASTLLFIGYSMPDSDGFMRALIQGAMASRSSRVAPRIYVFDPSEEVRVRYTKLFSGQNANVIASDHVLAEACKGELQQILTTSAKGRVDAGTAGELVR